ncbi:DNA/RNA helicase domain-containing protein [Amycolatopsis palatopharyngis]|uniref:DNA/RNA helicase domain-containing protein n=1 Tax=Amycolatopsis palatopharyngis TaxID=187982 RepID=UPI001FE556D4|nr:DNA/RNA helicase domain-containing protein [Amycolatopsis palatopharyngis]
MGCDSSAGTGKSVLAFDPARRGTARGLPGSDATGSQAFTTAPRKTAGHGSRQSQQLFQYFGTAADTEPGDLDLLVCDDAHQLRANSNIRCTPASRRSDRTQAAELFDAARVVVFCLDEEQAVRPGQIGTCPYIETAAHACGATVRTLHLDSRRRR